MRFNTPDTFWYLSSVARDITKCLGGLNRVKSKVLRLDISCIPRSSEKNNSMIYWINKTQMSILKICLYSSTSSTNSISLLEKKSLKCSDTVSLIKLGAILKYIVHMYIAIKNQKWYKKGAFQRVAPWKRVKVAWVPANGTWGLVCPQPRHGMISQSHTSVISNFLKSHWYQTFLNQTCVI